VLLSTFNEGKERMGKVRLVLRGAWMVGLLIACVPLHYLWKLAGAPSPWPRRFLRGIGRAAGMRVRVSGGPVDGGVLFVANHMSWLDIMILAGASGTAFVSKGEVGRWPVVGWLARMNATVFVERSARSAVRDQADALRSALERGRPVALFPEGTTDGGAEVLPFRASLLASLYPAMPGVRVQPVAIDYAEAGRDIAWVGEESAVANLKRVLSRRGTVGVKVAFLEPIDPAEVPGRKALAELARARILACLYPSPQGEVGRERGLGARAEPRSPNPLTPALSPLGRGGESRSSR
jgi:lyso-ornithine lipid O-acyltransferase